MVLVRLDHQINENNNLFLRLNADHYIDTNPDGIVGGNSLPSVDRVFTRRTYTAELGETDAISPNWLNNVRGEFQLASSITQFSPVIYGTEFSVPIQGAATFASGTSQSALLLNHADQVRQLFEKTIETYGTVDVVVNNAGIMPLSPIAKNEVEVFDRVIATNRVRSPLRTAP
jgi:hypothetical protein